MNLPAKIRRNARKLPNARRQAIAVQMALAIELLLVAPMRINNLAGLRLDQHIQRTGRKKQTVSIVLNEGEVKNENAQEYPLPKETVQLFDHYLAHHRPHLAEADSPWLFPGENGSGKRPVTLSDQISEVIFKQAGIRMTPHQFRHFAAMFLLKHNPNAYETVRRFLGHKNLKTTTSFYTGSESRAAVEHYDRLILDVRHDS